MPARRPTPPWLGPPGRVPGGSFRPPSIGTQPNALGVPLLDQVPAFAALWPNARLIVQMAFGATPLTDLTNPAVWTDVTHDVMYLDENVNAINIGSIGRPDAVTRTQPASCGFQLKNMTGKYSQGPQSPNYPNIRLNIPTRVGITLSGASNTVVWRFWGSAWSMKPTFDKTGNYAIVTVQAAGKTRQMQQGNTPLRNLLTRYHLSHGAIAVWPFDDAHLSTQAASAISTVQSMTVINGKVNFGNTTDQVPATGNVANLKVASPAGSDVATGAVNAPINGELHFDFWREEAAEPDASENQLFVLEMSGGSAALQSIEFRARMSQISPPVIAEWIVLASGTPILNTGVTIGTPGSPVDPFNGGVGGAWHNVHLSMLQTGTNVTSSIYIDGALADTHVSSSSTLPTQIINVHLKNSIVAGSGIGNSDGQGVVAVNTTSQGAPSFFVNSLYTGENVIDRLVRVCREEGIPLEVIGTSTVTMGTQPVDVPLNILRECEAADLGILGDGRGSGLYYISRAARYNQPVTVSLDVSAIADTLEPEGDDQRIRNKYTVTRKGGSSATYEQRTGPNGTDNIETYETTPDGGDLNISSDNPLYYIAAFLTSLGTVEGYRYPMLAIDWRRTEAVAQAASWLTMVPGNRLDIANVSNYVSQLPPETIDLLGEGWSEQLSRFMWRTSPINCSPARPWDIVTLGPGAAVPLILEMSGQTLAQDLSPGDVTLILQTASGFLPFTTTAQFPADFPRLLNVGGWKINCTAAGSGSPQQTLTITAAPNTRVVPAGTPVTVWRPPVLGL